jgi:threonine 3-dehydrogenase
MNKEIVLITGANGEIGHSLITDIGKTGNDLVIATDIQNLDEMLKPYCEDFFQGNILDPTVFDRLVLSIRRKGNKIRTIFHLASVLSTKAEHSPEAAHRVNVEGTINILKFAVDQAQYQSSSIKFLYPSSIAVYGLPSVSMKTQAGPIKESEWLQPITMYGCNKLYCEHLGRYYSNHYCQLKDEPNKYSVDFRCLRFPGLISAMTMPTGGTSDYGPEMLHHAAQGIPYDCFVRPDSRLPFMVMPDAVKSLLELEAASREKLSQSVYNVTSFSPTAQNIYDIAYKFFPSADISFAPHEKRQRIVDSWPSDVNDQAARSDWGWSPDYDQNRAFEEYLIPAIRSHYQK